MHIFIQMNMFYGFENILKKDLKQITDIKINENRK